MASFLKSDVLPPLKDAAMWVPRQMNSAGLQGTAGGWLFVSCALLIWDGSSPRPEKKVFTGWFSIVWLPNDSSLLPVTWNGSRHKNFTSIVFLRYLNPASQFNVIIDNCQVLSADLKIQSSEIIISPKPGLSQQAQSSMRLTIYYCCFFSVMLTVRFFLIRLPFCRECEERTYQKYNYIF